MLEILLALATVSATCVGGCILVLTEVRRRDRTYRVMLASQLLIALQTQRELRASLGCPGHEVDAVQRSIDETEDLLASLGHPEFRQTEVPA